VQSYIAPPIAAVFLLGLAWKRINAAGAMACLLSGFVFGTIRLVLELVNGADKEGLAEGLLKSIAEFNFLHFAVVLFVVCVVILVGVSLATSEPPHEKIAGLTFETADEPIADHGVSSQAGTEEGGVATKERTEEELALDLEEETRDRRRDLFLSIGVVICVALVWIVFA
jgi:SSS family solute:Na+ symporter